MSIERHGAITQPVKHDEYKVRRRFPVILILVYVPVTFHVIPIYFSAQYIKGVCMVNFSIPEGLEKALIYVYVLMDLIIPSFVMLFCYIRMALFLKRAMGIFSKGSKKSNYIG